MMARGILPDTKGQINFPPITCKSTPVLTNEMALSFNGVTLTPIRHQNSLWIRATELARALGYSEPRKVTQLYERNSDEFAPDMTQVVEIPDVPILSTTKNLITRSRIFSLRGCHLLAMFARTPVAKEFRKWVLDVLDKVAEEERPSLTSDLSRISKRTDPERKQLTAIINAWVGLADPTPFTIPRIS